MDDVTYLYLDDARRLRIARDEVHVQQERKMHGLSGPQWEPCDLDWKKDVKDTCCVAMLAMVRLYLK